MAKLPELKNDVNVIGRLKSKFVQHIEDEVEGNHKLRGNFTIEIDNNDGVIKQVRMNFNSNKFTNAGKESVQYKAIQTIDEEYKTIDEYGEDNADIVSAYGNLDTVEYVRDKDKKLLQYNSIKFVSMTRDIKEDDPKFKSELILEMVVNGFQESEKEEDMVLSGYSLGWKGRVNPVFDLAISKDIYSKVKDVYVEGTTITLVCEPSTIVTTTKEDIESDVLFGNYVPEPDIIERYEDEIRVISGFAPLKEGDDHFINEDQYSEIKMERERRKAILDAQQGAGLMAGATPTSNEDVPFLDDAPLF